MIKMACVCVLVLGAACGGSSPTSDCDSAASAICNKLFQCAQTAATQEYGTESGCEAKLQANANCASLTCPAGTTYNGSQFEDCINAVNAESCADATMSPTQCQNLTPVCQ